MYKKSVWFQLENWDAQAQLGSQPSQLGSAQLGKFQLELITNTYTFIPLGLAIIDMIM